MNSKIKRKIRHLRWSLAGILCRISARLRGETWYLAETFHGVPGNRASELHQQILDTIILKVEGGADRWVPVLEAVEPLTSELAQIAQAKWGYE